MSSFNRLIIDTAKYEGYSIIDVLLAVWKIIEKSDNKQSLYVRFLEELFEMDETCSSGHLSRVINVISGFNLINDHVKISFNEQVRNNVFARLNVSLKGMSKSDQDEILNQMTESKKDLLDEFIMAYEPRDELVEEFVTTGKHISLDEFEKIYKKAIQDYCGK